MRFLILVFVATVAPLSCTKTNPILGGWGFSRAGAGPHSSDILFTPTHVVSNGFRQAVEYQVNGNNIAVLEHGKVAYACEMLDQQSMNCEFPPFGKLLLKRKKVALKEPETVSNLTTESAEKLLHAAPDFAPTYVNIVIHEKEAECGQQQGWWKLQNGGTRAGQTVKVLAFQPKGTRELGGQGSMASPYSTWTFSYPTKRVLGKVSEPQPNASIDKGTLSDHEASEAKQVDFTWSWSPTTPALAACGINTARDEQKGQAFFWNIKDEGWSLLPKPLGVSYR